MSSVDVSCERASTYGKALGDLKMDLNDLPPYQPSFAAMIVSEVVSDIIDNALDIAISKSEVKWEESCKLALSEQSVIDQKLQALEITSSTIQQQKEINPNIKEIIEGLNCLTVSDACKAEEPESLDIEMKRILSEMMSPPYQIVNYENLPRKDGVGDQPFQPTPDEERDYLDNMSEDIMVEPETTRIVEKKSRVTDLVMNSKQILSEYLMDEVSRKKQDEWEEENEKLIRVIELDCVNPGQVPFSAKVDPKPKKVKLLPEEIPLPSDDNYECTSSKTDDRQTTDEEEEIMALPEDDVMDVIDLSSSAFQDEERQLEGNEDHHGGKGDEFNVIAVADVSSVPQEEVEQHVTCKTIVDPLKDSDDSLKKGGKKKKWNFGNRLWGLIKRRPKNKGETSGAEKEK